MLAAVGRRAAAPLHLGDTAGAVAAMAEHRSQDFPYDGPSPELRRPF